jgi:hypothetical protein
MQAAAATAAYLAANYGTGDVLAQQHCLQAHVNDELLCQDSEHAGGLLMQISEVWFFSTCCMSVTQNIQSCTLHCATADWTFVTTSCYCCLVWLLPGVL